MLLNIESKRIDPDIVVLELTGKITLGNESKRIEWKIDEFLKQNEKKVIFDLSNVKYIDSTGVGIIVLCCGKLKQSGGELRLAGVKGVVDEILKMTKVDHLVGFYPTAAAAAAGFSAAG
jgi:anti-sigma B factor antagonist